MAARPGITKRFVAITAALAGVLLPLAIIAGCGGDQKSDTATASTDQKTEAATALPADSGGRLQIAESSYDFGSVPVGQKVEHSFAVRNPGNGPLSLGKLDVKRLEGC
ncbi:MAG: hypothetical protein ACYDGS_03055 [Thermoleophilia bacterium]